MPCSLDALFHLLTKHLVARRMKAILFMLIRTVEFELAVPAEKIVPIGSFLQRPALHNYKGEGTQLPLLIRPYKRP